ncbi:MAG: hypothetical protein ABW144_19835 [Candidatus Thiodiazotropha sp.]
MRQRVSDPDPFGLSLLDMLACGLGAVTLLFILGEIGLGGMLQAAQDRRASAESVLTKARGRLAPEQLEQAARDMIASRSRTTNHWRSRFEGQSIAPLDGVSHLLILLDISGSMSRYARLHEPGRNTPVSEKLIREGRKWNDTLMLVLQTLVAAKDLKGYQILPITSPGSPWPQHLPLVDPNTRGWRDADTSLNTIRALADFKPKGGADHYRALTSASTYLSGKYGSRADALLIVTDGLPNFGPVYGCPDAALVDANDINLCVEAPLTGSVSPESKRRRAVAALKWLHEWMGTIRSEAHRPRIDVLQMPWNDDADLSVFAMELASAGRTGLVLSPGLPLHLTDSIVLGSP